LHSRRSTQMQTSSQSGKRSAHNTMLSSSPSFLLAPSLAFVVRCPCGFQSSELMRKALTPLSINFSPCYVTFEGY
jgi:hypothetical protein